MCSKLNFGKLSSKIGEKVYVVNGEKTGQATFSGFAKLSSHDFWKRKGGAVSVSVSANTIIEGSTELKIPAGKLMALGLKQNVIVNGKLVGTAGSVKLVTREAQSHFEKSINAHGRIPVVIVNGGIHVFTSKDIVKGQTELPLGDDKKVPF